MTCNFNRPMHIYDCTSKDITDKNLPNLDPSIGQKVYFIDNYLSCPDLRKYGHMSISILRNNREIDCDCLKSNKGQQVFPCSDKSDDVKSETLTLEIVLGLLGTMIVVGLISLMLYLWYRKRKNRQQYRVMNGNFN